MIFQHSVFASLVFALSGFSAVAGADDGQTVEARLQAYVEDYRQDPNGEWDVTFGIEVDGHMWHVIAHPYDASMGYADVTLHAGAPEGPYFYYTLDVPTLGKLETGQWTGLTAMGKAKASDVTPMDVDVTEGYVPPADFDDIVRRMSFHFWVQGQPEIIRLERGSTRLVHGTDIGVIYYQEGFRSGWLDVRPGQHVNEPEDEQVNPFPSVFVVTKGHGTARIGGEELQVEEGDSIFIPPGTPHEFWNGHDGDFQMILMMFGEGA